jgi:hypothetical protein
MANLSSIFDVVRGWPYSSALQYSFKQKDLVSPDIEEGTVVAVEDESGVAVVDRWTSAADASGNLDNPWLVMRGRDEEDAVFTDKLSCVKLRTGVMFRVATSETPLPGNLVYANAGVVTTVDPGTAPAFGVVVEFNEDEGWMVVES